MAVPGIVLLAFLVRLVYLLQIRDNPFFAHPFVESRLYDDLARGVAAGIMPEGAFKQAPLYPLFLGLLYRLLGHDYFGVRLVQIAVGAINCGLVAELGRRTFNQRSGLVAGVIAAFYAPLVFYDAELQRPFLIVFFSLGALLAILAAAERLSAWRWAAAGLLLGGGAVTWEPMLLVLPGALLWLFGSLRARISGRQIIRAAACLCVAAAMVILPVTARNCRESGEFVLISAWGGLNFYLGNNPTGAAGTDIQPGDAWDALVSTPSRVAGITGPAQQSRWFYREALRLIQEQPLAWAGLLGRKFLLFWNAVEYEPNNDLSFYREKSSLFRLLYWPLLPIALPFGAVAPLALLGIALTPASNRRARLVLLFVLTSMCALVLFHVRARYRLPAAATLVVFSGWAVDRLAAGFSGGWAWPRRAAALFATAGLILFVNADFLSLRGVASFPLHATLGKAYLENGRLDEARREFEIAVAADPGDYDAWVNLGVIQERQGRSDEAGAAFQAAIRANPAYAVAHNDLGAWYHARGMTDDAIASLRQAIRLQPDYATAHRNLGIAYAGAGRHEEANAAFARAQELELRERREPPGKERAAGDPPLTAPPPDRAGPRSP